MTEPKRITVKVSDELHHKVKVKAVVVGKTVSEIVREYLENWVLPEFGESETTAIFFKKRDP